MGDEKTFVVVHEIKGNKMLELAGEMAATTNPEHVIKGDEMLAGERAATNPERHDIYTVDGVRVPMVFEIPKVVLPFVYKGADGNMKRCVPEKKEVTFDQPLGKALFAEWQGSWEMHIDDPDEKKTYRIRLFQDRDHGAQISFQTPTSRGRHKKTMGPRQGHWQIESDGSVIAGEFNFGFPDNDNFIGFRVYRREPTKPYIYEGTDMKGREVRLTIGSREIFCQSSCVWKRTELI